MRIGFTGARVGMTDEQKQAFKNYVMKFDYVEFHHGDCIGADAEAHAIVREHPAHTIIIHPPKDSAHRAYCQGDVARAPKTHFARNRDIVEETQETVGTPWQNQQPDPPQGGTWYTILYSEKRDHITHTIWPDGTILSFGGKDGILCSCCQCK